jgi:hypothetical protein
MGIRDTGKVHQVDQGEDAVLDEYLIDGETGDPVDLAAVAAIKARFRKADGTVLELTLAGGAIAVLSVPGAKVRVTIGDASTALLLAGDRQDFEIEATLASGDVKKFKFPRALSVAPAFGS